MNCISGASGPRKLLSFVTNKNNYCKKFLDFLPYKNNISMLQKSKLNSKKLKKDIQCNSHKAYPLLTFRAQT